MIAALAIFGGLSAAVPVRAAAPASSTPTVSAIVFEGAADLPVAELLDAVLPLKSSGPWSPAAADLGAQSVASAFRNRGWLEVRVSTSAEAAGSSVTWRVQISTGPLYRIGETRYEGVETVNRRIVERELDYKIGDPYSPRALYRSQSRLYKTRFFDEVWTRISTTSAKTVIVEISVKERRLKYLKAGAGFGSEEKERLSLVLTYHNFLNRGYQAEAAVNRSRIWLEYRGEFTNRDFFGTRIEQSTRFTWRREDRSGYDTESTQGRVGLARAIGWDTTADLHYRLQRTVAFNVDSDISETTPGETVTGTLGTALNRDTSNDLFFPTRGTRSGISLERTGWLFGGNVHFVKTAMDASGYQSLFGPVVGTLHGAFGALRPTDRTTDVPVYERFFTGGAGSIRGYRERHVGPLDSFGAPRGASMHLGGRAEIRSHLFWRLTGAVFLDGGQVGAKPSQVQPSRWKYGTGGGIRVRTPIGPLRADMGYKVNPDPGDRDRWRLHLSVGEAF